MASVKTTRETSDAREPDAQPESCSLPEGLWVVIAAYNEQQRICAVIDELLAHTANILVVDDGSRDATAQRALQRPVWLLQHQVNLGQGAALQTGISGALARGAEYIVTFDADGQHRPEDIYTLLEALHDSSADFALGSRFLGATEGMPRTRRILLRLATLFTRVVSGVRLSDAHNGIRLMTRKGAEQIGITLNRMEHASEIIDQIAASQLPYVEAPVTIHYTPETLAKGQKSTAAVGLAARILLERLAR